MISPLWYHFGWLTHDTPIVPSFSEANHWFYDVLCNLPSGSRGTSPRPPQVPAGFLPPYPPQKGERG